MNENIEYKKGWQIEKNGSPNSLHFKFSNDKIIHGIDTSLNLGLAEMENKLNKRILESFDRVMKLNEWEVGTKEDTELIKHSLFHKKEFWEQEPALANVVSRTIFKITMFDEGDEDELII